VMPNWAKFCQTEAAREGDLTPLPILRLNLIFHLLETNHRLPAGPLQRIS